MAEPIQTKIDTFFEAIEASADSSQALGQDIPLLGANLANIAPAPLAPFATVQAEIDTALASLTADATATQIADALNGAGVTGLVATVTTTNTGQAVSIALQATDVEMLAKTGAALDLGVPVLQFNATADFAGTLTSTLNTTLDYNVGQQTLTLADAGTKDLDIALGVTVAADATASLGPLGVSVVTNNTTPATPQVVLDFIADLDQTPAGLGVGDVSTTGAVGLDLAMKTTAAASLLPTIGADLKVGYGVGDAGASEPSVALDDITVDLGGLIDEIAQTVAPITDIFDKTPFKQIIKGLLGPVPIINDAAQLLSMLDKTLDQVPTPGDGVISPLDLAVLYYGATGQPAAADTIKVFAEALAIIQQLNNFANLGDSGTGGLGGIDLGSIQLVGNTSAPEPDAGGTQPPGGVAPDALHPGAAGPTTMFAGPATDQTTTISTMAGSLFGGDASGYQGATSAGPTALANGITGVPGLSIPLLDDPNGSSIESILLPALFPNQPPTTLVSYTLQELSFHAEVPPSDPLFIPIIGPFGLTLGGTLDGSLDFTVGYNTAGLLDGKPADGLYISPANPDDPAIASITGEVDAGLGVDLDIVRASINGGIKATVTVQLDQDEVPIDQFPRGFVPVGRLAAEVNVVLKVGFGPFSFEINDNIADITIIDFAAGNGAGTIDEAAMLAHAQTGEDGSNDIILNTGPRAEHRPIDKNDDDESYGISNSAVDTNGNPTTDTLDVSALGVEDLFGAPGQPIQAITADLGVGNNTLVIDPAVTLAVTVSAGDGNNAFKAGGGPATFSAGGGGNNFYGGSAPSTFVSGAGDDFFHPGSGPLTIEATSGGHNQITYENSPTAVTTVAATTPMSTEDLPGLFGSGGTAQGDYLHQRQCHHRIELRRPTHRAARHKHDARRRPWQRQADRRCGGRLPDRRPRGRRHRWRRGRKRHQLHHLPG